MVKFFLITTGNLVFLVAAANVVGLRVNTTESYPQGVYRLVDPVWHKHDLVESCLPDHVRDFALSRGYLQHEGRCDGHPSIIKQVLAVAGDTISRKATLSINGVVQKNAQILGMDGQGRPLQAALSPSQSIVIADNYVWLMSFHNELSFDSRYFGAIHQKYVLGKLEPLWVF